MRADGAARRPASSATGSTTPATILVRRALLALGLGGGIAGVLVAPGCTERSAPPRPCVWVMAGPEPEFDPAGPPDPARRAIERLLTRGLIEEDSSGVLRPAAAERWEISHDSLACTFHLRPGLAFTDGTPCGSGDFERALRAGLGRKDHSTQAWLLSALKGVDLVRPGKALPELGIEVPDAQTLTLRLVRPDPRLLEKLALPGVSDAWSERGGGHWSRAAGLGPYRVAFADSGRRLVLARAAPGAQPAAGADTVILRFGLSTGRIRTLLRSAAPDLVWPVPPGLLDEPLPAGYRIRSREAVPHRRLLLVMRADLPPTSRVPTRHALAHALNRSDLIQPLGRFARELDTWQDGVRPFVFPPFDGEEVRQWMERADLGRSFHVVVAYDADGVAAPLARQMQGEWSHLAIYAELEPLRGRRLRSECLTGLSHVLLVDSQGLIRDPAADLAALVMPLRGPAVGSFRTGWRTREFDAWLYPQRGPAPPLPVAQAQQRLEEELVALPLFELPWLWVERENAAARCHPHFGPECPAPAAAPHASKRPRSGRSSAKG